MPNFLQSPHFLFFMSSSCNVSLSRNLGLSFLSTSSKEPARFRLRINRRDVKRNRRALKVPLFFFSFSCLSPFNFSSLLHFSFLFNSSKKLLSLSIRTLSLTSTSNPLTSVFSPLFSFFLSSSSSSSFSTSSFSPSFFFFSFSSC